MVKCPKCGEEYSWGRKIVHICDHHIIFHGIIFQEKKKRYGWNFKDIDKYT